MISEETIQTSDEELNYTDREIFTKIWTSPRQVFRFINETYYEKYFVLLLVLTGIVNALDKVEQKDVNDIMSLLTNILISIFAGGLFGWISIYVYSRLLAWTGKWLNAEGDAESILRMLAYAAIPTVCTLFIFLVQVLIFGKQIFLEEFEISGKISFQWMMYNLFVFLHLILSGWSVVLAVIGNSEVQKLSIGKSILNMIFPALIIVIPIMIIVLLFARIG